MASRPLLLRPGTPVLSRSPGVLQVGLRPPSVTLPDLPAVRALLDELTGPAGHHPADEPAPEAAEALTRLLDAGLALFEVPGVAAHLLAQAGPDAVRRRAARATSPVALSRAHPRNLGFTKK